MNEQKVLWESLAKEKAQYYIMGRTLSAADFRQTGKTDYKQFILDDKLINSMYPNKKQIVILDIGCGTGRMTEFMARDFKRVIGTDISDEMVKQGQQRLQGSENIRLLVNDGENLPLADSSIDLAFSYWVYQHIKTKSSVKRNFEEVYRVLKPGQLFKVAIRSLKPFRKESWWSGVQFDKLTAKELYQDAGFSLLKQSYRPDSYVFWLWLKK